MQVGLFRCSPGALRLPAQNPQPGEEPARLRIFEREKKPPLLAAGFVKWRDLRPP